MSYWKYLKPQLASSCTEDSKILVVGAQQCEDMVEKIYNLEYKHITCTDSKKEVIADMLNKHLIDGNRTEIKWRVLESVFSQKLMSRKSKDPFDVVIDNGTLHALISQDEIKAYISQLRNILTTRKGGKFICFIDCSTTTTNTQLLVNTFLEEFRYTYKLFFQILVKSQVTMFVIERAITFTVYLIQYNIENLQMLNEIIKEENSKRLKMLEKSKLSLEDITSGAMGDPNIILEGRKFWIQHKVKRIPYKILVMDFDHLPSFTYSWLVFYASKADSLFFTTEKVVDAIARHACASRVYVILLNEMQDSFDRKHLDETELRPLFEKLAPGKSTTGPFWSTKITGDALLNLKKEDICESKFAVKI